MPIYPGDINVSIEHIKNLEEDQYTAYTLLTGMHVGTHIDCPMHLLPDEKTIAEYPLECFVGEGILLDCRGEMSIDMKEAYRHMIKPNAIVLFYTGMDEKYGEEVYYNNHPTLTETLADFLVAQKVKMIGIDMPSPDSHPFNIHKVLLGNGIFIIENMRDLKELLGIQSFEIIAFPLKIEAEASLIRAVAQIPAER